MYQLDGKNILRQTILLGLTCTLALAASCDKASEIPVAPSARPALQPTTLLPVPRAMAQGTGPQARLIRVASAHLAELNQNFGGAYVDPKTKTLHVLLTDLANPFTLRETIEREVHARGRPELLVSLRRARFSYRQLEAWQDSLLSTFGHSRGVVLWEIDERNNRLRVGIAAEGARVAVTQAIARAGIPDSAVNISVVASPQPYATLRDRYRPLRGGLQIFIAVDQDGYGRQEYTCTYGVNVRYNGTAHMVTNSHCTQSGFFGGLINANGAQPGNSNAYKYGVEIQDPARFTGYPCPSGENCRYSDAALFRVDDLEWDLGGIMRTTQRGTLPTYYPSLNISSSSRIGLVGVISDVYVGDVLEKVGRTTGWSAGEVISTSSNQSTSEGTRLDNISVRAAAGMGDSGSPVFFQGSSGYVLAGILWGGTANFDGIVGDTYYLSKWRNVDYELGSVTNDLYPVAPGGGGACVPQPGQPCPL